MGVEAVGPSVACCQPLAWALVAVVVAEALQLCRACEASQAQSQMPLQRYPLG